MSGDPAPLRSPPVTTAPESLDPDALFHLASPDEWAAHQAQGSIAPPSLASEGFVHCSWGHQVAGTVGRHFAGAEALLALRLDPDALDSELVVEDSYGSGQAYPHVYAPIPTAAVVETVALTLPG